MVLKFPRTGNLRSLCKLNIGDMTENLISTYLSGLFLFCCSRITMTLEIRLYNLFHILIIKTSYHQLENFKRIEKKLEKSSINRIIGFDHKDMK